MSSMSGQLQKQIADALRRQDAAKAGRLADRMRFDYGFKYADVMKQVAPCSSSRSASMVA